MGRAAHRAVIFDLDGVITDTAEFHYLAWQRLADEEGIAFDRAANEALRGISRRESLLKLLGDTSVEEAELQRMMEAKNRYYVDSLATMSPHDILPGAVRLVVDARRRGLRVAIGSSSRNAYTVLGKLELTELFDAVADGHSVERAKPAPDLFLAAAELLGVEPAACVVVEDAGSGVDAALAAGMTAVGVGPADRVGHAHHRFASTDEIDLAQVVAPEEVRLADGPLLQDGWVLVEDGHDPEQVVSVATNHLTANGYLGYRGTLAEWDASATVGCTVTDTWDSADGKWTELCNVPNALVARWSSAHDPVEAPAQAGPFGRDVLERRLDIRYGRQHRVLVPGTGAVERLIDERFASMDQHHLLAQWQRVEAAPGTRLTLRTGIDGQVWSLNGDHFGRVESAAADDDVLLMHVETSERRLPITVAHAVAIHGGQVTGQQLERAERQLYRRMDVEVGPEGHLDVEQVMAVHSGNDVDDPATASRELVRASLEVGYETLLARHALAWERRWERIDVAIDGDPVAQAVLRFNLYHNVVATPMHADHLPIGARGLSCQAYQGAAFWDQEAFNLPMWQYTFPEVARNVLHYRYRTLAGARRKAARLGYHGAFYAWISGDTGDELCPDFFFRDVLTGRPIRNHFNDWQIHISPDIAAAVMSYVTATGDEGFLRRYGAEIIVEVARFLASRVHLRPADGAYHLLRLLGPDEYHENVDDEVFTLEQSRRVLRQAVAVLDHLATHHADAHAQLQERLGLDAGEPQLWSEIAEGLVNVTPDARGVLEQFRGYAQLEDVTPDVVRSRLLHPDEYWGWPNGVAVHTQVIKQADVVQLFVAQPDAFDLGTVEANYDHYLARTQHGSSLSRPAYALVAARLGRVDEAEQLFLRGASVDLLADAHTAPGGTFIGGIHTAACGASWQVAVLGFGGVEVTADHVEISPRLPRGWERLGFGVAVRGCWLRVSATPERVVVTGADDNPAPVALRLDGRDLELAPGASVAVDAGEAPQRRGG